MLEAGLSKGRRDGFFWSVFLSIAIIGTITWLAIFEHNYQPRIYRDNEEVTILQVGDAEWEEECAALAWMCGIEHTRETKPLPRMLYRLYP